MPFHLADARAVADAAALRDTYGRTATDHAAARARSARNNGNHLHFCHWRQIERLLRLLDTQGAVGTIH